MRALQFPTDFVSSYLTFYVNSTWQSLTHTHTPRAFWSGEKEVNNSQYDSSNFINDSSKHTDGDWEETFYYIVHVVPRFVFAFLSSANKISHDSVSRFILCHLNTNYSYGTVLVYL